MNIRETAALLVQFAEDNKDKLNQLDGAQGDGDLGITIYLAAKALEDSVSDRGSVKEWFETGGKALRKAAPSTMGILIASALIAAGKSMQELEQGLTEISLQEWASIQQRMIDEIQKRGGAKLGDKTVLDAFIPAVQAFTEAVHNGKSLGNTLEDSVRAAKEGADNTVLLASKIGRSSWLGERANGNIDGGAWVCYQLYKLFASTVPGYGTEGRVSL